MHVDRDKTSESRPRGTDLDKTIIHAFPGLTDETLSRESVVEREIWGIQVEKVDIRGNITGCRPAQEMTAIHPGTHT